MRIKTYILIPRKKFTFMDALEQMFYFIYETIIPVIGAYGFFISHNMIFLFLIILPAFVRVKLEPRVERIYKGEVKKHTKK